MRLHAYSSDHDTADTLVGADPSAVRMSAAAAVKVSSSSVQDDAAVDTAQVSKITGESDGTEQTVLVNLNSTQVEWNIDAGLQSMKIDTTGDSSSTTYTLTLNSQQLFSCPLSEGDVV